MAVEVRMVPVRDGIRLRPDPWQRQYRDHGAVQLAHTARRIYDYGDEGRKLVGRIGFRDWYRHLPLIALDTAAGTPPNQLWNDSVSHSTDMEVTGPVGVKLYAVTPARDTDFIARLIDVYPDGTAYNLTEGILRARFRESIWEPPKLLRPGKVYEYTIDLMVTSNVFLKGHRIRVHVTSSSFPMWDRNPNTGHEQAMDAELAVADQTVYHDRKYPSYIVLPVVPARR